ncbi:unnamed protein product [Peronospora belbahrii]|uniref:Mitochondrial inner membrane protease subunit n=1 Tax=Peronospora belbahrii TaxID=622444 RepID=A0ABN8D6F1_9STRA|nr:unnamed protein product [Peronospora belbahrii]
MTISTALQEVRLVFSCFARFGGVAFCFMQVGDTIKCVGPSMLPTLNRDGDIVLLDKFTPRLWKLQPGEVVIAKSMSNPRQSVCKRIIAQEGETVCVRPRYSSSVVEFHKERWLNFVVTSWELTGFDDCFFASSYFVLQIPKGHVWLEGDNKHDSHDSRYYGPVPCALVQGRVVMRIWPLNQLKWMKKEASPQAFREI